MSNDLLYQDRLPPQSLEAEQSVLGSILIDNSVAPAAIAILESDHFYKTTHRYVYEAIVELASKNDGVDIVTLSNYLEQKAQLNEVGGAAFLANLQTSTVSAANIESYAKIVKDKYILRKLITVSNDVVKSVFDGNMNTQEILDKAEQKIFDVAGNDVSMDPRSISDILDKTINDLHETDWKPQDGVKTGFRLLDKLTLGFHPGELIILAARPSMGKTSLALNIARHMAFMENAPVAVFSLEMSSDNLARNMLCMHSRTDAQKFRNGTLSAEERQSLVMHAGELSEASIFIDDTPGISPFELRLSARRLKERYNIKAVFVDYLQLMRVGGNVESRQVEISQISGSLKALAMELKIPVIALSQLSRKLEDRVDKRPMMSDLRESGSIEQDADTILMLFREWVYNKEKPETLAEINVVKQRNGPTGGLSLCFFGNQMRFENADNPFE